MSQATDYAGVEEAAGFQPSGVSRSVIGVTDTSAQYNVDMRGNGVARTIDERRVQLLPKHVVVCQCTPRNRTRLFCASDERRELADIVKPLEKSVTGLG